VKKKKKERIGAGLSPRAAFPKAPANSLFDTRSKPDRIWRITILRFFWQGAGNSGIRASKLSARNSSHCGAMPARVRRSKSGARNRSPNPRCRFFDIRAPEPPLLLLAARNYIGSAEDDDARHWCSLPSGKTPNTPHLALAHVSRKKNWNCPPPLPPRVGEQIFSAAAGGADRPIGHRPMARSTGVNLWPINFPPVAVLSK